MGKGAGEGVGIYLFTLISGGCLIRFFFQLMFVSIFANTE